VNLYTLGFPIFIRGVDYIINSKKELLRFSEAGVSPTPYSLSG